MFRKYVSFTPPFPNILEQINADCCHGKKKKSYFTILTTGYQIYGRY